MTKKTEIMDLKLILQSSSNGITEPMSKTIFDQSFNKIVYYFGSLEIKTLNIITLTKMLSSNKSVKISYC